MDRVRTPSGQADLVHHSVDRMRNLVRGSHDSDARDHTVIFGQAKNAPLPVWACRAQRRKNIDSIILSLDTGNQRSRFRRLSSRAGHADAS